MIAKLLLVSLMIQAAGAPVATISNNCAKIYKKESSDICFCVTRNLQTKLSPSQLSTLATLYVSKGARIQALKSQAKKPLLELDFLIHSQCSKDPNWQLPSEDMGQPDALGD